MNVTLLFLTYRKHPQNKATAVDNAAMAPVVDTEPET